MVLQNKKKFYLIGTNASDIGDCTLQAIEKVKHAKVVVLSKKFDSKFSNYWRIKKYTFRKIFPRKMIEVCGRKFMNCSNLLI